MKRLLHRTNAALFGLLFGGSLWAFPALPDQIPRHFGFWGTADAYGETTLLHWMLLPLVAFGTGAVIYGSAWVIGQTPSSINVPNQQPYDALDPVDQRRIVTDVQALLYGMATAVLILLGALQMGIYEVATSPAEALPTYVTGASVVFVIVVGGGSAGLVWWLPRRIRTLSGGTNDPPG